MWEDKMFRIKVIFRLLHFGFKSDMNFHFDFFCGLFSSILWIGLPIVFFRLIFLNIDSFNGWDYYQILFLVIREYFFWSCDHFYKLWKFKCTFKFIKNIILYPFFNVWLYYILFNLVSNND